MPTWSGDNWSLNPSHESDHSQLVTKLSVSNNILESQFTGGHVKEMLLKMKPHSNGKSGCRNWLRFVIFIWTHLLQSGVLMLQWGSLATTNWMNSLCFPKLLKSPRVGSHYLPSLWIVEFLWDFVFAFDLQRTTFDKSNRGKGANLQFPNELPSPRQHLAPPGTMGKVTLSDPRLSSWLYFHNVHCAIVQCTVYMLVDMMNSQMNGKLE